MTIDHWSDVLKHVRTCLRAGRCLVAEGLWLVRLLVVRRSATCRPLAFVQHDSCES